MADFPLFIVNWNGYRIPAGNSANWDAQPQRSNVNNPGVGVTAQNSGTPVTTTKANGKTWTANGQATECSLHVERSRS